LLARERERERESLRVGKRKMAMGRERSALRMKSSRRLVC
jgi:hypothetical protein